MNLIHEITSGIWAIEKPIADAHMMRVISLLKGDAVRNESHEEDRKQSRMIDFACASKGNVFKVSEYGYDVQPEDAPENSVALMKIGGVITKSDQYCGSAGMVTKSNLLKRMDRSQNIKAIILQIESGGGEGYAAMHMNEVIKSIEKPVIAFIDDMSCSAAYYIASACDHVVANSDLARIGSIGTYVSFPDYREMLEMNGIKMVEVYATKSEDKNKDYLDARDGDTKLLKASIDVFNEKFLSDVSENRGKKLKGDWKTWGTGKVFYAPKALEEGLIDEINTLDNTINSFF